MRNVSEVKITSVDYLVKRTDVTAQGDEYFFEKVSFGDDFWQIKGELFTLRIPNCFDLMDNIFEDLLKSFNEHETYGHEYTAFRVYTVDSPVLGDVYFCIKESEDHKSFELLEFHEDKGYLSKWTKSVEQFEYNDEDEVICSLLEANGLHVTNLSF